MSSASDIELVPRNRLRGSKAAHELLCSDYSESSGTEDAWRKALVQSGAVSASGVAWTMAVMGVFATESESVTPLRVLSIGASQFVSPWEFEQSQVQDAIALLDEWLDDDSGYDEETWPELKESLDRDRLSDRRLFDG